MKITWKTIPFNQLSLKLFHDIIQLREEVFVVEQICPYLDVDGKDIDAFHVIGMDGEKVVATARILKPGVSYDEVAVGRVVVKENYRQHKLGHRLMEETISFIKAKFGLVPIRISAQTYLIKYYNSHGFEVISKEYLEDNIPHIQMLREVK